MLGGFSVVAVPSCGPLPTLPVASALGQVLGLCRLYKRGKIIRRCLSGSIAMLNTSAECSYAFEGDFGTFLSSKYA